ncbi:MAG: NUDIX domain-containing protein [Planctomycetes bacterium]|nr:NUDIX domain-containing protein [Planctomycetota bacterium]
MRKAAGFIVFVRAGTTPRFLLLRNARHGTWSVPKGHLHDAEEALSGAWRELQEETGITQLKIWPGFEEVLSYSVPAGKRKDGAEAYEKELRLFLGEAASMAWTRSKEHDIGAWMDLEGCLDKVQHEILRDALRRAATRIASGA